MSIESSSMSIASSMRIGSGESLSLTSISISSVCSGLKSGESLSMIYIYQAWVVTETTTHA